MDDAARKRANNDHSATTVNRTLRCSDGQDYARATVIKKRIGTKHPSTTVKQRVTVGTTLPADVELTPLPDEIYTEVPSIKNYRYVVVGDEIVLVEPQTRRVIEVFPE